VPNSDFTNDPRRPGFELPPTGQSRPRPPRPPSVQLDESDERGDPVAALVPYTNPRALIAYYLGVFSLIPALGALLGPAALVLGILGLKHVKAKPAARGTGHAIAGIVLGSLTSLFNWGLILFLGLAMMAGAFK
jgi:hypothetical protein